MSYFNECGKTLTKYYKDNINNNKDKRCKNKNEYIYVI